MEFTEIKELEDIIRGVYDLRRSILPSSYALSLFGEGMRKLLESSPPCGNGGYLIFR